MAGTNPVLFRRAEFRRCVAGTARSLFRPTKSSNLNCVVRCSTSHSTVWDTESATDNRLSSRNHSDSNFRVREWIPSSIRIKTFSSFPDRKALCGVRHRKDASGKDPVESKQQLVDRNCNGRANESDYSDARRGMLCDLLSIHRLLFRLFLVELALEL